MEHDATHVHAFFPAYLIRIAASSLQTADRGDEATQRRWLAGKGGCVFSFQADKISSTPTHQARSCHHALQRGARSHSMAELRNASDGVEQSAPTGYTPSRIHYERDMVAAAHTQAIRQSAVDERSSTRIVKLQLAQ